MSRKASPYNQILQLLHHLHKAHPHHNMGRHLSMALGDYEDVWGLPDREMLFALEKYQAQLESDVASPMDIDKIIKDAMDLDNILNDTENGEDND